MKKAIIIVLLFSTLNAVATKPVYPDFSLWNTLNVTYKLNAKVGLLFTQEWRLRENASRLNLFYTNLGVTYNITKGFKTGLIYRHIDKYLLDEQRFSFRNRIMWDLSYKHDYQNWNFSYRHRAQFEWMDFLTSELGRSPQMFSRNKFEVGYEFGNFQPYISSEIRIQLTDPRNNQDDDNIGRNRVIVGMDYSVNKYFNCGAYFLNQREFNTVTPQILYLVGLQFNFKLDKYLSAQKPKSKKDVKK